MGYAKRKKVGQKYPLYSQMRTIKTTSSKDFQAKRSRLPQSFTSYMAKSME